MIPDPTHLIVIDDDEAVRDALGVLLETAGYRVDVFASAEDCLATPQALGAGCVLADVRMPGMSGLDLQKHLATDRQAPPVILITGHGNVAMAVAALKAGAADFIEKPFDEGDLLRSIARVLESDQDRRRTAARIEELRERLASLTPREREVMDLVTRGHSNKSVALNLGISPRTVEIHRGRAMEKMGALSIADLVRIAARLELTH